MPPDEPLTTSLALIEGLAMRSLSDWLQVGRRYVNMSQAQCVEDDPDGAPPMLTLWFPQQRVSVTSADRLKVLAWLAEQVSSDLGALPV